MFEGRAPYGLSPLFASTGRSMSTLRRARAPLKLWGCKPSGTRRSYLRSGERAAPWGVTTDTRIEGWAGKAPDFFRQERSYFKTVGRRLMFEGRAPYGLSPLFASTGRSMSTLRRARPR
jgi:hypothetical protein